MEEAAAKYLDHIDVDVHIPGEKNVHISGEKDVYIPGEKGVYKRGISESTLGLEREVEGERGRTAPAVPNDAERGDSEVPSVSRYGRQRRVKRRE